MLSLSTITRPLGLVRPKVTRKLRISTSSTFNNSFSSPSSFQGNHRRWNSSEINNQHGALTGEGFTRDGLYVWAKEHWETSEKEDENKTHGEPHVDMFSRSISNECAHWLLTSSEDPSSQLATAFFSSIRFAPERILLTYAFDKDLSKMPVTWNMGEEYLAWTVVRKSQFEIIMTWQLGPGRGGTMLGFDPVLSKVYLGSTLPPSISQSPMLVVTTPIHDVYSEFLMTGTIDYIEKQLSQNVDKNKQLV